MDTDEFLAHYGVKGMKWGVRNRSESSGPSRSDRRKKNRELNKAAKAKEKATAGYKSQVIKESSKFVSNDAKFRAATTKDRLARDKQIDDARKRMSSGQTSIDYQKAKAQHKANKEKLGSYEARKILKLAGLKAVRDEHNSQASKDGKEMVTNMLFSAGAGVLSTAVRRY